ncbi:SH3 domain-containing protein [Streptomyces sp. DT2A-34]|uniref:SH3 domain-containing protein n=1 Tax=Streptomyces sp. DT2A-34 TaxID=3051182 RepID=UPI00265C4B2D|nr:SH3 domain-containing protein [Streptomyces sp. DT2A-34]MDO0912100.1 SH3 domain-containing protein [Streptomyces sp. DT2A-34]
MQIRHTLVRALAASALGLAVTAGGLTATASAVSLPAGCIAHYAQTMKTDAAVNLRKKPTRSSTSLGILQKGTKFRTYCSKDFLWYYGKVGSGANKGKYGWVVADYLIP